MTSENSYAVDDIPPEMHSGSHYSVPATVRWGLVDVLFAVLALVLSAAAGIGIALSGIRLDPDAVQFVIGILTYALITLVVVRATVRKGRRSLAKDFRLGFRPVDLVIGIGAGIGLRLLSAVFVLLASVATGHLPTSGNFTLSTSGLWIVLTGLLVASLIAPVVEELFVRGLVLQSVRNIVLRFRGREQPAPPRTQRRAMWISIVVSAVFFALLHSGQSADATVVLSLGASTLAVGFVNAVLVYATGRLGAGIVTHIVFNASSIVFAIVASGLG